MLHRPIGRIEVLRAPDGVEGEPAPVVVERDLSDAQAVEMLTRRREAPEKNEATPEEAGAEGSGDEPDAAPPDEEPSGETEGEADPAGEPPIDPPRSWTKADKEVFASLPRETQLRLVEIDRARELEVRKGQNEVAERTKAANAERAAAEQARQQYEQNLLPTINLMVSELARDFPEVRDMDSLQRLAQTNPARYVAFQARAEVLKARTREAQTAQQRQQQEAQQSFAQFVADQERMFLEKAPEFATADDKKLRALQDDVRATLKEVGFSDTDLEAAWSGAPVSMRDHRVQLIIRDALRYRNAQAKLKAAAPRPVQPAVRPGVASTRGEASAGVISSLKQKLASTGSDRDAVALLRAKRESGRRAG